MRAHTHFHDSRKTRKSRFCRYLGLSGPIWAYLGLSGPVWACRGLSGEAEYVEADYVEADYVEADHA